MTYTQWILILFSDLGCLGICSSYTLFWQRTSRWNYPSHILLNIGYVWAALLWLLWLFLHPCAFVCLYVNGWMGNFIYTVGNTFSWISVLVGEYRRVKLILLIIHTVYVFIYLNVELYIIRMSRMEASLMWFSYCPFLNGLHFVTLNLNFKIQFVSLSETTEFGYFSPA